MECLQCIARRRALRRRAGTAFTHSMTPASDSPFRNRGRVCFRGAHGSAFRALREPCGALPPILNGDSPASALCRSGTSIGTGALLGPSHAFRFRHLTNHKLPGRNLLAHELELRLPRVVIPFPACLRHYRSLPSLRGLRIRIDCKSQGFLLLQRSAGERDRAST